jgi:ribosomal protein L4
MGTLLEVSERTHESLALRGDKGAEATNRTPREEARERDLVGDGKRLSARAHARRARTPTRRSAHLHHGHRALGEEADRAWMVKMLRAGTNVVRINCAHEGEHEWGQMVQR